MKRFRAVILTVSAAVLLLSALSSVYLYHAGRDAGVDFGLGHSFFPIRNSQSAIRNPHGISSDSTLAVRVAVLNGCGRPGICTPFVRRLRAQGFDVVNGMGGNADSFDFAVSVVVDRRGGGTRAVDTARALGISRILSQRPSNPFLVEDVAVIIGRDWNTLYISVEENPE